MRLICPFFFVVARVSIGFVRERQAHSLSRHNSVSLWELVRSQVGLSNGRVES